MHIVLYLISEIAIFVLLACLIACLALMTLLKTDPAWVAPLVKWCGVPVLGGG